VGIISNINSDFLLPFFEVSKDYSGKIVIIIIITSQCTEHFLSSLLFLLSDYVLVAYKIYIMLTPEQDGGVCLIT